MFIGNAQFRLHFPEPQSLKEKRMILKSVLTRLRQTFNVGVAELEGMDLWQFAEIAVVCAGRERKEVEKTLDEVSRFLEKEDRLQLGEVEKEVL